MSRLLRSHRAWRWTAVLGVAVLASLACDGPARAAESGTLTPAEIVAGAADLDGSRVTVEGEAIGDRLHGDGGSVWINILDEGTAIGVFVEKDLADSVESFGDYSRTGDRVRVRGVMHAACDGHGGDLDLHASELEIVAAGKAREHDVDYGLGIAGLVAMALALGLRRLANARRLRAGEAP